jgi:hypothetical protein
MRTQSLPLPQRVAAIAARQHGVVSRSQLLELEIHPSLMKRWVNAGHLHRVYRAVYAVGHRRITWEGQRMAAVLACGPGAFLSHTPAGQLQRIVERRLRTAMHVSLTGRADRSPAGIVTHRPRNLDARDTRRFLNIPVTTPTRTVWDLATMLSPRETRRAFARAEKLDLLDRSRLGSLIASNPSHKGAGVIRALLGEAALPLDRTRSWLEDLFVFICSEHNLPLPLVNVGLLGYEADFLWPDAKFIVEADGGDHLDRAQRDRDNERDATHGRAGHLIRRYSSTAMGREDEVAAEVLSILRERLRR